MNYFLFEEELVAQQPRLNLEWVKHYHKDMNIKTASLYVYIANCP